MPLFLPDSTWTPPSELPDLRRVSELVIDVENRDDGLASGRGSGWPYRAGHITGIAAAWYNGEGRPKSIYIPLRHPDTPCIGGDNVKSWLAHHFAPGGPTIITHHGSHDWGWLSAEFGLKHAECLDDTEAMAVMVDENRLSYRLDALCEWRGIPGKDETLLREAALSFDYKGKDVKENLWRLPGRYVGPYAEQDAVAELMLASELRPIVKEEGCWDAYRLEMDLMPVVHEMRRRGIRIDVDAADMIKAVMIGKRDAVLAELSDSLAEQVTMKECRSWKFLEKVFDLQHIGYERTRTGRGSFTRDWMHDHPHWLPRLIARADQLDSAANKFIQGYLIDFAVNSRLHATVNQFRGEEGGTKSHRFSYSDPPLQQMPARDDEFAAAIRGVFLPEPGEVWLSADYSQQEYRLIVHYAEMRGKTRAAEAGELYRNDPNTDFHQMVVDWTGLDRRSAKNANFAKSYGAGIKKFAAMINMEPADAEQIYRKYDKELPFVTELAKLCQDLAERDGYIRLCDGARSHFDMWEPRYKKEWVASRPRAKAIEAWGPRNIRRADCHKAMNRLIQGGAARQTKAAIRLCARAGYIPMLQMHDELCFSVTSEKQGQEIGELMREAAKMLIPSKVDLEYGETWGDAKHGWNGEELKKPTPKTTVVKLPEPKKRCEPISISLTEDDLDNATQEATLQMQRKSAKGRNSDHGGKSVRNLDKRLEDTINGLCGEIAAAKAHGRVWTPGGVEISTGEVDGWEVRTTRYPTGHLLIYRKDSDDSVIVAVYGSFPEYDVYLPIRIGDLKRKEFWRDSDPPCYWIPRYIVEDYQDV